MALGMSLQSTCEIGRPSLRRLRSGPFCLPLHTSLCLSLARLMARLPQVMIMPPGT